jgi:Fur family transcriptional regulator, ferric uptake regulator
MTTSLEKYATLLRGNEFKATQPRIKILEVLDKSLQPLTASEVHDKVLPLDIDLATVYRTLNKLADAGVLNRIEFGDEFSRFEYARVAKHHHHIVCSECGKVSEINLCNLDAIANDISKSTGFTHIQHQVVFRGWCERCTVTTP